jgi:hypothetical protein
MTTANGTQAAIKKSSHEYARNLQRLAEWLLERPEFEVGRYVNHSYNFFTYDEKEPFLAAARAIGQGKKQFTENFVRLELELPFALIRLEAPRNKVCTLISPAVYDCVPFLSPDEEKQIGGEHV